MRRRSFIAGLGSAAAWPVVALGQQSAMPVIGYLSSNPPEVIKERLKAFRQSLADAGHLEGRNVAITSRWTDGEQQQLPALAADLVRSGVRVILTSGTGSARAAKAASTTVPIVFVVESNPIAVGLIVSLSRPGGNITGVTGLGREVAPKRLELLDGWVPKTGVIALLVNPTGPDIESEIETMQEAARKLDRHVHVLFASRDPEIDVVFAEAGRLPSAALVIVTDSLFTSRLKKLATLALRHTIPTIFQYREFAAAGGLLSYGSDPDDYYRLAAGYVGRILNGERPGDLPVQQSAKVGLIINMKTAKALGVTLPLSLLGRADEVIE
jgi:putative tryptophan/tyrosine transport system substrate-binding protein